MPCKNVLKGSVCHFSCLESLILSINPSILLHYPSILQKESLTFCCSSAALPKCSEGVCGPLLLFRIPNSVACFLSQIYPCTPPNFLGIDEIFQKRYCMTLYFEALQSYQCSKLNFCLERVFYIVNRATGVT